MDRRDVARAGRVACLLMAGASLAACATVQPRYSAHTPTPKPPVGQGVYKVGEPYQVAGVWYVPREQPDYDQTGVASWYGEQFQMKTTANGEIFDMNLNSAAHTTLPLPSIVEVTNLENGRKLKLRVNDRGPFIGGRIIDLSREAARELGYDRQGLAQVRVRYIGPAPLGGPQDGVRYAQAAIPAPAAPLRTKPAETITVASSLPSPTAVSVQQLAPLASAPPPQASSVAAFRIQAGAFSDQVNAQRAVAQLASAGAAVIEPMQRQGTTLYRVLLQGPADEAEAFAFRDRVAGIGSPDARVVRPF